MATYQDLNNIYKEYFNKDFPRATLTKWVKTKKIRAEKNDGRYDYNLNDFKKQILSDSYKKMFKASKEKPEDYIGKVVNKLYIKGIVPKEEKKEPNYTGTLMYCDCLQCGKQNVQVRFSYLTPNGNYHQETCGCERKIRAFLANSDSRLTSYTFVSQFKDFEKYLFLHKALIRTNKRKVSEYTRQEYENMILYFYNQKEFNALYCFWQQQERTNTFYDLAKPSLDHKNPYSKTQDTSLENLQFLTLFENLAKRDMSWEEWILFKEKTNTQSDFYLNKILEWYDGRENIG